MEEKYVNGTYSEATTMQLNASASDNRRRPMSCPYTRRPRELDIPPPWIAPCQPTFRLGREYWIVLRTKAPLKRDGPGACIIVRT